MPTPRALPALLLALLAASGCSAMFLLGTSNNIVDDGGEEGLTQQHLFSKSVSILGPDGEPQRVVREVVRGRPYRVSVTLAWQDEEGPGPVERTWRFTRDGEIFGSVTDLVDVDRSPFVFEVDGDSIDKPSGRYGYQLYIDDRRITRIDVVIVDTPTPIPTPRRPNRGW